MHAATRRVLHRWFIEYNPLYLFSAAFVLFGSILSSRELAHEESIRGGLAVAAVAELYALALIGSAALLVRIGQRRSAVMLALLVVLCQGDLTLHTETCPNLGAWAAIASAAWFVVSGTKLALLARALRLRVSRDVFAIGVAGALGLAAFPHVLPRLGPRLGTGLVIAWLFALFAFATSRVSWTSLGVTCLDEQDAWGETVRRRALRAASLLWFLLLLLHVTFWSLEGRVMLLPLALLAPLFAALFTRDEARTWSFVTTTLVFVVLVVPDAFATTALVASGVLALSAHARARGSAATATGLVLGAVGPYREATRTACAPASAQDAVRRLAVGSAVLFHLGVWTVPWKGGGGAWPEHVLVLDLVVTAMLVVGAAKARARIGLLPASALWMHRLLEARLVPAPRSACEWGVASTGLGFALLVLAVGTSMWARDPSAPGPQRLGEPEDESRKSV